jgi:glycosyltransferase involved in cell wall biosynthesis
MKILIFSQQYWPENWRITSIAETLVSRGHTVAVVCGLPNDSHGQILPAYRKRSFFEEDHNGVHLYRIPDRKRGTTKFELFLKYRSFCKNGSKFVSKLPADFDVVFANQLSPVMQAEPALSYGKRFHKKVLLYCLDLWPESLEAGGVHPHGVFAPIFHHYFKISSNIYTQCDRILVSSPDFSERLHKNFNLPRDKIGLLYQYAEPIFYQPLPTPFFSDSKRHFVFAGNVGKAQDLKTLVQAARVVIDHPNIEVDVVGDGSALRALENYATKLEASNVHFLDRRPLESMPSLFASATAMIVTLSSVSFASLTIPGKVPAYLAAGKPIIAAANGSVSLLVREAGCGIAVASGDVRGLADALLYFETASANDLERFSQNAKRCSLARFTAKDFFPTLEKELMLLVR